MGEALLEVKNLQKYFSTPRGMLHAVDNVSFTIEKGKTLGVVGESGCGKTTCGRTILRLTEPTGGQVLFDGKDISTMDELIEIKNTKNVGDKVEVTFYRRNEEKTVTLTLGEQ